MISHEERLDPWSSGMIDLATQQAILRAVGDLLRRARKACDFRLADLARQCDMSESVLCRIELARRYPGSPTLLAISAKLGIRLSDLIRAAEDAAVPELFATQREGRFGELLGSLNKAPSVREINENNSDTEAQPCKGWLLQERDNGH